MHKLCRLMDLCLLSGQEYSEYGIPNHSIVNRGCGVQPFHLYRAWILPKKLCSKLFWIWWNMPAPFDATATPRCPMGLVIGQYLVRKVRCLVRLECSVHWSSWRRYHLQRILISLFFRGGPQCNFGHIWGRRAGGVRGNYWWWLTHWYKCHE